MSNNNAAYRKYADALAARLAAFVGKPAPRCTRVNQNRGWAHWHLNQFSVAGWAMQRAPAYRDYYIAHEACHCFVKTSGHGPDFQLMEDRLMNFLGLRLVREEGGPYAEEIHPVIAGAGPTKPLCVKFGVAI